MHESGGGGQKKGRRASNFNEAEMYGEMGRSPKKSRID